MSFENRWMIVGNLTTASPLHIGSGDTTPRTKLINSRTNQPVDINAVCTDKNGRPYIPGSTLKGNLRAWGKRAGSDLANFEQLFGSEDPEKKNSVGGKVEFYDAVAVSAPDFSEENQPPYWRSDRFTGVMAGVTIDRRTKTASEERLFHHEFVPPGVSFSITITGQNLTDSELEDLLFVLAGFNHEEVTLGAGEEDGWGRLSWQLVDLRRLTSDQVSSWINSGSPTVGYSALGSLSEAERQNWIEKVDARQTDTANSSKLTVAVILDFESHFLVNDPSRTGKAEEGKTSQAPLLDADGRLMLPSSSFRGALRSQAERILRTMRGPQACCYPDSKGPRAACKAVYEISELGRLCPACKVFGAPGWKSPIAITDFKTAEPVPSPSEEEAKTRGHSSGRLCTQEFVAIDRFTGGGAHGSEDDSAEDKEEGSSGGKKFNVGSVYRPQLNGTLMVDFKALHQAGAADWAAGLLALSLRDLMEGDMRLGFGAAKGYGALTAGIRIVQVPTWSICPREFQQGLSEDSWSVDLFSTDSDGLLMNALCAQVAAIENIAG